VLAAGAVFAGALAAGATVFAAGASVFAAGAAVFALASVETAAGAAGVSAGASGLLESTETLPVRAGIESRSADSIKRIAAVIVSFDSTVAVPRGLNAELDTLLVNNAPASVLPGCSNTAPMSVMHERKNITYNKYSNFLTAYL